MQLELITTRFKDLGMTIPRFLPESFTIRDCYLISCGEMREFAENADDDFILEMFVEHYTEIMQAISRYDLNDVISDNFFNTVYKCYLMAAHEWCLVAVNVVTELVEDGTITPIDPDSSVVPLVRH